MSNSCLVQSVYHADERPAYKGFGFSPSDMEAGDLARLTWHVLRTERVGLVGALGRWKGPCLEIETAPDATRVMPVAYFTVLLKDGAMKETAVGGLSV